METAGYEAGVKAPGGGAVAKSRQAEEVEERLCRGGCISGWEVAGCRGDEGGGGAKERGIPVPGVKSGGKSEWPCRSVSKQASAAVIWANIFQEITGKEPRGNGCEDVLDPETTQPSQRAAEQAD